MPKTISFLLLAIFLSTPLAIFADESRLTVQGFAHLRKPADKLTVSISVITDGESAREALSENSEKMNHVVDSLKKILSEEGDIQTGSFDIRPVMTQRPAHPTADWVPTISGYRATNKIIIETHNLTLAGSIIDTATTAGASAISSLNFTLRDPRAYRSEAIKQAADHAKADADSLAAAIDVRLGEILDVTLDETAFSPVRMMQPMALAETQTPIEIGEVEVTAAVKIVYEIESH
jgi:uncharacterized protein